VAAPPKCPPPEDGAALFRRAVRKLRNAAGLTLEEAAELIDISPNYLGKLERGKGIPSFEMIVRLAAAYNVGPSVFFKGREPRTERECRALIGAMLERCSPQQLQLFYRALLAVRLPE